MNIQNAYIDAFTRVACEGCIFIPTALHELVAFIIPSNALQARHLPMQSERLLVIPRECVIYCDDFFLFFVPDLCDHL